MKTYMNTTILKTLYLKAFIKIRVHYKANFFTLYFVLPSLLVKALLYKKKKKKNKQIK